MDYNSGDIVALGSGAYGLDGDDGSRRFVRIIDPIKPIYDDNKNQSWIVTGPNSKALRIVKSCNLAPLTQAEQHDYVLAILEDRQGMLISKDL